MSFISLVVTIFVMFTVLNFVADVIQNRYDVEHIKTWIVAMELCDEDAALAECRLSSRFSDRVPYLLHGETLRRFHAALKKCEDAKERQNARKHAVKIAEESSPGEMAKLILSGVYYDSQLVAGIDEKEYAELFFYAMTQCLALGRVGLTNELLLYHEIVTVADCRRKILEDRLSKEPLTLPEDWTSCLSSSTILRSSSSTSTRVSRSKRCGPLRVVLSRCAMCPWQRLSWRTAYTMTTPCLRASNTVR